MGSLLVAWPDYLCAAFIALGAVGGFLAGFVRLLSGVAALVSGVAAAAWGTGPVVGWCGQAGWVDALARFIQARLPAAVARAPVGGRVPLAWGEGWPPALRRLVQGRAEELFASTAGPVTVGELLARAGAELLVSVVVFLVILAVVQGCLRWAGAKLAAWVAGRGLGWPDRLAGVLLGAARNAFLASVLAAGALSLATLLPVPGGAIHRGGLTWTLAEWFNGAVLPWLLARLP